MTDISANQPGTARILVIGGAGEMGAYACRALAKADEVAQVLIADRDLRRATELADELGPRAVPLALDIADTGALAESLAGVDIVLNTAGPFYRFGREVLSAAIATGTHYLDICDDWEPTLEMLELDDAARAAGVTAVIGMGASPGTSNLLALLTMNRLDTVDRVFTAWRAGALPYPAEGEEPQTNAALEHWVHNCTEPIKIWRDGKLVDAHALEELTVSYPGRGAGAVWVCGHPEPLTLPRVRPEVRESLNLMVSRRGLMAGMQRVAARVRSGELDVRGASKQILLEPGTGGSAAGPAPTLPNLFAVAEGTKDGKRLRVGAQPIVLPNANMGEMTGYPLAVATLMMARGQVDKPGVHGPESTVDPDTYFQELSLLVEDRPGGPVVEVVDEAF
ncbi:saccharopine dehydrogenase NADP-binding domain-containing protein [Streptomyces noursei]|uniref:saccharopine dehydrogenase family protein n=1 Tax=Streptomyces noursei TaxID=1971 RepID=UPI0033182C3A